jgi:hypothetical protein
VLPAFPADGAVLKCGREADENPGVSAAPSPESPRPEADLRCLVCGAKVRPEENWCSLCHTPVGHTPDGPAATAPDGADTPSGAAGTAGDGERPAPREVDPEAVAAAEKLLAQLAADEAAREDTWNVVPREGLSGRRGTALAIGGGVAFALLLVLGLTLLGLFL